MNNWNKFNEDIEKRVHDDIHFYRALYHGEHSELFQRAIDLKKNGEIIDQAAGGPVHAKNVQIPYIMANLSKIIAEIPATFVARSIGEVKTAYKPEVQGETSTEAADMIDGPEEGVATNTDVLNRQQELLDQITSNSNLTVDEHWTNIVHHQVDGGLVGVPFMDDDGIRIEFKGREMYYPHDNSKGGDLIYRFTYTDEQDNETDYIHIYTEYVENGDLYYTHQLKELSTDGTAELVEDTEVIQRVLGMSVLSGSFKGRSKPFIEYWANERTFKYPLGVSCLKGQGGKQDEINWTLTRNAITFERNGKPRIIVTKDVMSRLQEIAVDQYGDDSKIDSRNLEVTTFDDQGKGMEVVQLDISKIGTFENVKNYMKLMLMETQTSEKAVDFYLGEGGSAAAISGVAKYYDLIVSLLKAERVQEGYVSFLKRLYESALWHANNADPAMGIQIEQPEIDLKDMVPISRKEVVDENIMAYEKGAQSLETTIRKIHAGASEEWIEAEVERVKLDNESINSSTLSGMNMTSGNLVGNAIRRLGEPEETEEETVTIE